jgi:hypothetical protein
MALKESVREIGLGPLVQPEAARVGMMHDFQLSVTQAVGGDNGPAISALNLATVSTHADSDNNRCGCKASSKASNLLPPCSALARVARSYSLHKY